MTTNDYIMVMKTVRIAALKARLSEHLRAVRRGETLTVMDRSTPIAWVVPYAAVGEALSVREATRQSPSLQRVPPASGSPVNARRDPTADGSSLARAAGGQPRDGNARRHARDGRARVRAQSGGSLRREAAPTRDRACRRDRRSLPTSPSSPRRW